MMKKLVLASALAGLACMASAQTYVGAAMGSAKYKTDCEGVANCDLRDTVIKLYAGQRVSEWVSAEAAFVRFGKAKASGPADLDGQSVNIDDLTQRAQALALAAAFRYEVAPGLVGVARIGAAVVHGKGAARATVVGGPANGAVVKVSESETTVRPYFGLGLAYRVMPNLSATLDYDRTSVAIGDTTDGIYSVMAGLAYQF